MSEKFQIKSYTFDQDTIDNLAAAEHKEENWPVVYQIFNNENVYIGETTSLKTRMQQHYNNPNKVGLHNGTVKVIFGNTFNKSVALDLESYLIRYISGDRRFNVLNRNDGLLDRDYYEREDYRKMFDEIWENLRSLNIATHTIAEINNSEIFKFSPYKNLNFEQLKVVTDILMDLDEAFVQNVKTLSIIGGDAGTGKTIVIMYLTKLLADLQTFDNENDDVDDESNFGIFFEQSHMNARFKNRKIALVVPQESLRKRIAGIFDKVGLANADIRIFSPVSFAECNDRFDITLVDEAHLLKIGIAHASQNVKAKAINQKLFGTERGFTELDWIAAKSDNIVMVYSEEQRARQTHIMESDIDKISENFTKRQYYLRQQMRSLGGQTYINYINNIFSRSMHPAQKEVFPDFEAKIFTCMQDLVDMIAEREKEYGLSRLVAGFAWEWASKKDVSAYDINIDGVSLKWNRPGKLPASSEAATTVASIYTVQGEDLNYVGLIIGPELRYKKGRICFDEAHYCDGAAKKRNERQIDSGVEITDDDLLAQVLRIYKILLTRAIKGVYLYVCDEKLRAYLSRYFDVV